MRARPVKFSSSVKTGYVPGELTFLRFSLSFLMDLGRAALRII